MSLRVKHRAFQVVGRALIYVGDRLFFLSHHSHVPHIMLDIGWPDRIVKVINTIISAGTAEKPLNVHVKYEQKHGRAPHRLDIVRATTGADRAAVDRKWRDGGLQPMATLENSGKAGLPRAQNAARCLQLTLQRSGDTHRAIGTFRAVFDVQQREPRHNDQSRETFVSMLTPHVVF